MITSLLLAMQLSVAPPPSNPVHQADSAPPILTRPRFEQHGRRVLLAQIQWTAETVMVTGVSMDPDLVLVFDTHQEFLQWSVGTAYEDEVEEKVQLAQAGQRGFWKWLFQFFIRSTFTLSPWGTVHEDISYGGNQLATVLTRFPTLWFAGLNKKVSSAKAFTGLTLAQGSFYTGPTLWIFHQWIPDLGILGWNDRARSIF